MKAVFLDRDGVINRNTNFVNTLEDFELLPNVRNSILLLKEAGFKIFVVTNQAGVERGYLTEDILQEIHYKLKQLIPEIDDIRYCPFVESFERKPNPGMLYDLAYENEIFLNESYMVGDMLTDAIAGRRAGCKTILLMTNILDVMKYHDNSSVDSVAEDLMDATKQILFNEGLL